MDMTTLEGAGGGGVVAVLVLIITKLLNRKRNGKDSALCLSHERAIGSLETAVANLTQLIGSSDTRMADRSREGAENLKAMILVVDAQGRQLSAIDAHVIDMTAGIVRVNVLLDKLREVLPK